MLFWVNLKLPFQLLVPIGIWILVDMVRECFIACICLIVWKVIRGVRLVSVYFIFGFWIQLIHLLLLLWSVLFSYWSNVGFSYCWCWLLKWTVRFTVVAMVYCVLLMSVIDGLDNGVMPERVTTIAKFLFCLMRSKYVLLNEIIDDDF